MTQPHDPYAALRFRDFRLLIGGRFVAQIGEMMVSVGVSWELYQRTGDAFALGLVGLVQVIPVLLLSLPGGYIADRYDRRIITLLSQLVLIFCSLALVLISVTQGSLLAFYSVLALIGVARAFNNPAESALTPQTIPAEHYYNAATWNTSVWQISAISGPAVGGALLALTQNPAVVYGANVLAGAALVAVLLVLNVQYKDSEQPAQEPPLKSLREGLDFLGRSRVILASITLDMFAVLLGGAVALMPIFAEEILFVGAFGLGLLRAAPSIGALAMAMMLARRPPSSQAGRTLLLVVAGCGAATIIFALSRNFWLSLLTMVAFGALDNVSVVIRHTLVLTRTPDAMRGRVNAVNYMFIGASNELGAFESGVAAAVLGTVGAVLFGGVGMILVTAIVALWSPELRSLKELQPTVTPEQDTNVRRAAEEKALRLAE